MSPLQNIATGMTAVKHLVSLAVLAVAGIVSITLLFSQVDATEKKAMSNSEHIEKLETALGGIKSRQQVIITEIAGEKEKNKEFRDRTDRNLNRILDRLTPPGNNGNNR